MNWENSEMEQKFTGKAARLDAVPTIDGGIVFCESRPQQMFYEPDRMITVSLASRLYEETYNPVSSKDLGDPNIGEVITWHLSLCPVCKPDGKPEPFGVRSDKYCQEYWDIFQEYAEYETKYAWRGNP